MGVKGCWTCRERKVRCDVQRPTCGNCSKARRVCQGYGMQLSWPRDGDGKRAIVARDVDAAARGQNRNLYPPRARFVNAGAWDVELAMRLELENKNEDCIAVATGDYDRRYNVSFLRSMSLQSPRPTYLPPVVMGKEESHLLEFFTESTSLMLGPTDAETLANFILRIALSNSESSDTTNAVLQAVLAIASLQLHGNGSADAFRYKRRVVSNIAGETTDSLGERALLRNLVATMLLYHYEMSMPGSSSEGTWVTFFCAVKRIINTSPAMYKLIRREYKVFLDWIYYHEALSEFTVRHWKAPYDGCGFVPMVRSAGVMDGFRPGSKVDESIGYPTEVLELVVYACRQAIVAPRPEMAYTAAELDRATVLERHISMEVGDFGPIPAPTATPRNRRTIVADLHRVACLIYVNRAVHRVSERDFRHRRLVREGILLLSELQTCQSAWPLFVIGCEAMDEKQRAAILDVCERSRGDTRRRSSHVDSIQRLVAAVWNQRDLDEEGQIDHMTILDAVIGGDAVMPLFA
ncbi:hypothetical protein PSPO01_06367 [Paraphaeosphaeria sporulosa]